MKGKKCKRQSDILEDWKAIGLAKSIIQECKGETQVHISGNAHLNQTDTQRKLLERLIPGQDLQETVS